jgi:hypothetical protein
MHHTLTASFPPMLYVSDAKNKITACQQTDLLFERAMKTRKLKNTAFRRHGKCIYKNTFGLHFYKNLHSLWASFPCFKERAVLNIIKYNDVKNNTQK